MVQRLFKFGGGEGSQVDRRFLAFEDKTIDEQADEVTRQLVWAEDAPIFEFDSSDRSALKDYQKELFVASITIGGLWYVDVRVLNRTSWGLNLGPLRKFALINTLNLPVYWYFLNSVKQAHMNLKKHLVTRYLISGGEVLFKRKIT